MALIDTKTISNSKIKFRFSEPYASEGANIQQGVNLPGAYRGALVQESSPSTDRTFWINRETGDADSIVLHRDAVNGYCTVVRETANVQMDCSSNLTWPIASETTLYVYMSVDYTIGSETAGVFGAVSTPGEVPANAVMLAHVVLPVGATEILQEYVKTDGAKRDKVGRKRGLVVMKRADYPTTGSPRSGFEITDKVCWMGQYSNVYQRVRLGDGLLLSSFPLRGSDGGQVLAGQWYDIEGGTVLSFSDLDEDGCYTNPWVDFDFNDTADTNNTGAFTAWYWGYVPFDELNAEDRNVGFFRDHTNSVIGRDSNDTPDSIVENPLDVQIDGLLSLINARIRMSNPDAATSSWALLWRSNNVVDDADVDNDTISVYWKEDGMLLAHGGYIDGNDFKVDATGSTGQIFVWFVDNQRITYGTGNAVALPFSANIGSSSQWDEYKYSDAKDAAWFNNDCDFDFWEHAKVNMRGIPDAGGNDAYLEMLRLSDGNLRGYWGGNSDRDQNDFLICWGCRWDDAGGVWVKTATASFDAYMLAIGRTGMRVYRKDYNDADYGTGWGVGGWTNAISLTGAVEATNIAEDVVIPFKIVMSEKYVWLLKDVTINGPTVRESVNFRRERATVPGTFSWSTMPGERMITSNSVDAVDEKSIQVSGVVDVTSQAVYPYPLRRLNPHDHFGGGTLDPFAAPDKIRVAASSIPSYQTIGYVVGVRGTANNNGAWAVVSWTTGTDGAQTYVEFTVDTKNGQDLVVNEATGVGKYMYMLPTDRNGEEITAYHVITVED